MNRIKEHLGKRDDLPSGIQKLKAIGQHGAMPLEQDGKPIGMIEAAFGLGAILGAMACRDFVNDREVVEACHFIKGFSTPKELRDAIWGPEGGGE